MSVSALVGENALFHCAADTGAAIVWIVDGLLATDPIIVNRTITVNGVSLSSGAIQSTLTVPATLVNNGTTVQCVIYPGSLTSNNATLSVLPGELCSTDNNFVLTLYRYWSSWQCENQSIFQ